MSFLTLAAGLPNFDKAVISLWFRVPMESATATGFLPLVTFGQQQTAKVYNTPLRDVAVLHDLPPTITYMTAHYVEDTSAAYLLDPCHIALGGFTAEGQFGLDFFIQTAVRMNLSAQTFQTTQMELWSGSDPDAPTDAATPGSGTVMIFPLVGRAVIEDVSYSDTAVPEFFNVTSNGGLEPDTWHHLLLSFDISGSVSIGSPFASSTCRLWYAIDDVDYRGAENLQPYRELEGGRWGRDNLDPNAIITRNAWAYSGFNPSYFSGRTYQNQFISAPQGTLAAGTAQVPSNLAPLGIPSSSAYKDNILRCEMAEFQMWTGVTLDTGVLQNRRRFVDDDGKPVNPTKTTKDNPNDPSEVAKTPGEHLFGRMPEILLHGSNNWKRGYNTGTLGIEEDSEGNTVEIPSGQFEPTAKIERYKPDPSLEPPTA